MRFDFSNLRPDWFVGSVAASNIITAAQLLFPAGERYFVRSVQRFQSRFVHDERMRADIRGFIGQEGTHAAQVEELLAALDSLGYKTKPFCEALDRSVLRPLEARFPAELNLAITAALEHYTAITARLMMQMPQLDEAHPGFVRLIRWHALEELEHKAVAFDVMERVCPSYAYRVAGMFFATTLMAAGWFASFAMLSKQRGQSLPDAFLEIRRVREERAIDAKIVTDVFLSGIAEYLLPGFHPNNTSDQQMLERGLRELEL
ncbi:MAG: metal-dependent hydrolase [Polyangiales bacterium]